MDPAEVAWVKLASPADWVKAGNIGYGFREDGIDTLIDKFAELELNRPDDNSLYRSRFGVCFEWLRKRVDDLAFDEIRDPVRDFIMEIYPAPRGGQVLGVENPMDSTHLMDAFSKSTIH